MEIWMNSVEELVNLIETKIITAEQLQQYYLKRLNILDEKVKAFIHYKKECKPLHTKGPLAGIPYAVKDNIVALGTTTTAASKMLWNYRSPYNASVVDHLNNSGAILMGKTNMDEFSMGSTTQNSAFFPTKNPWDLNRIPGGSSGGSAVAVSTGMVPFALGSDTGGSIRLPASYCSVVGLKPTYGLVSRDGLIAFASSMDQIGPITRSVRDAALILNVISQTCPFDSTQSGKKVDFLDEIEVPISGYRLACIKETVQERCDNGVRKRFEDALQRLQWLGVKIDYVSLDQFHRSYPVYVIISSAEASSNLARYDGVLYGLRYTPEYSSNAIDETRKMGFGQEVKRRIMLGTFNLSHQQYEDYYQRALLMRRNLSESLKAIFKTYDAIITPVSGKTPGKVVEKTDIKTLCEYDANTVLANLAGMPAISVPMGMVGTTPVGLQIITDRFQDDKLLRIARAYEKTAGFYEDGYYPAPHLEGIDDV